MEFLREVKEFIENNLLGAEAELVLTDGGRIVGKVLWQGFDNQDELARQEYLWNLFRNHFHARAAQIGILFMYTPHELRIMQSA